MKKTILFLGLLAILVICIVCLQFTTETIPSIGLSVIIIVSGISCLSLLNS